MSTSRLPSLPLAGLIALAGLTTGWACTYLEDSLVNAECFSSEDCAGDLSCAIPQPLDANDQPANVTQIGWCLETPDSCEPGIQPFCSCALNPMTSMPSCTGPGDYGGYRMIAGTEACWDKVNMDTCLCYPLGSDCPYDN